MKSIKDEEEMSKNKCRASLIIPTYNKYQRLKLMLESLKRVKCRELLEIIIINDGSTDETLSILQEFEREVKCNDLFQICIISTPNQGRSNARNEGVKVASGEVLIFIDDDVILDEMFILNHMKAHTVSDQLMVHGRILNLAYLKFFDNPSTGKLYDGRMVEGALKQCCINCTMFQNNEIKSYLQRYSNLSKFEKDIFELYESTTIDDSLLRWIGCTGGNISILKSNLLKSGLFDSNLGKEWGCEDLELGYRLYKQGFKFIYDQTAINYHMAHVHSNYKDEHRVAFEYFKNKHNDMIIKLLEPYFSNESTSLIEWRNRVYEIIHKV